MLNLFNEICFECLHSDDSMVILGDCIDVLSRMKEQSVDLIFADPPYNLGKDFGNNSDNWSDRKNYLEWCYR